MCTSRIHARRHAWLDAHPALQRRFRPEDYDGGRHDVAGLIFVRAGCRDDEARDRRAGWPISRCAIRACAGSSPTRRCIWARGPAKRSPAGRTARCRRRAPAPPKEPTLLLGDPALAEGVRLLGEHGLPFDLCVRHHQLRAVATLVGACPEVTFVLDHLGKPPVAAGKLDPWRRDLERLAAAGRVFCKLSGLTTEARPGWRPADCALTSSTRSRSSARTAA